MQAEDYRKVPEVGVTNPTIDVLAHIAPSASSRTPSLASRNAMPSST